MKISIITTTFNSGKTIRDTIESVLKQTYQDYEYIIKDGASTDDTLEIIRQYEPRFKGKLKVISAPDKGIYDGMNKGIAVATGDVVGILNSDDFYTTDDILQSVYTVLNQSPDLDAVYGDLHYVNRRDLNKCVRYFTSRYFRPCLLRCGFMPGHQSFYCRRTVHERYGLYNLKYQTSSDFDMMVRLFAKYKIKTKYINKDFVTMRLGGMSTAGLRSKIKVNKDVAASLKDHGIYSNQLLQGVRYLWRIGEVLYARIWF
jgi:glycosyltransferase involved in cell wall biosynthesis